MSNFEIGDIVFPKENVSVETYTVYGNPDTTTFIRDTELVELADGVALTATKIKMALESINALETTTVTEIEEIIENCDIVLHEVIAEIGRDLTEELET